MCDRSYRYDQSGTASVIRSVDCVRSFGGVLIRNLETMQIQILYPFRDHRNAPSRSRRRWAGDIQKWCVLERRVALDTESHAQPLLTVGDHSNGTIVHHQEWKAKRIQFEKLVIQ